MSSRWLDTNADMDTFITSNLFTIRIDGTEYTAIKDRSYSFQTVSPSRIIQEGFDYSSHSMIQPCTVSYTIVVSKLDKTELTNLLKLFDEQTVFMLENPVYTIQNCIIASVALDDTDIDAYTLTIEIKELNSSIQLEADDDSSFQLISGDNLSCSAEYAVETDEYLSNEKNPADDAVVFQTACVVKCNNETSIPLMGPLTGEVMETPNFNPPMDSIKSTKTYSTVTMQNYVCVTSVVQQ